MKKIKLFTLALAALFVGNAVAQTTVFSWRTDGNAPAVNTTLTAVGGELFAGTTSSDKTFKTESAAYASIVPDDMKSTGKKGLKLGSSALYFKASLTAGSFLMGDTIFVCGYKNWKISSTAEQTGDIALALATGKDKTDYQVGKVVLSADVDTLWFMRADPETSSAISAIKVVRPDVAADVATLKSITVDGKALEGFDPATETYNVELPFGTTAVPVVEAVATSKNANAVVTPAAAIPGATTIVVTAEDGTTIKTYTINFTAAQTASSEKELLNVTIDGKAVAISENAGSLLVSKNADLTALVVNFEVSESATASIESGSTQDFTNPLSIVVTAQDKSTATYTLTVTKAEKDVLYLTTASVEGDKMYGVVAAKGFYIEVRGEKNDNTDFSGYDLVILHESLSGRDAADGELNELATANVPVLNTKSYFYPEGRWGWGACSNGNDQQGVKVNTAKYTNIASHPLFAGLNDSITIYSTAKDKNIQPVTSFAEGKEGYVLANVAGGAAIHELPAAARVGAEGTAKYLLISLLNGQYADLTAEAETLLGNAVDYLLSAEAWVPQSGPQTALDNAVVAEKAQKMIVNGQLVIVKDGVMYNAQGATINK